MRRTAIIASYSFAIIATTNAFSNSHHHRQVKTVPSRTITTTRQYASSAGQRSKNNFEIDHNNNNDVDVDVFLRPIASAVTAASLALALTLATTATTPLVAHAYDESDYASETVTEVVSKLKSSAGNVDGTFNTLEEVGKIITEGKGVGGTLTYDGVRLSPGVVVADEDTTIYNPGLTLLTSSEKERLVDAIVDNRQIGLKKGQWSENNEYAFDFLKQKLDPLHMRELSGYLGVLPFYGAALYLGAIFAQKNARDIFPLVYGLCALGVFGPAIVLVALGP